MNPSEFLEKVLRKARRLIPKGVFKQLQPIYHYLLALVGAIIYRFPAKQLFVIGVTGTKGKSTTVELITAMLDEAGMKTASAGTVRFKIGEKTWPNTYKMTMPGRFFLQSFLRKAKNNGCAYAIIEMTSEGSKQFRYEFTYPDALIFTNLSPEHVESHGSYEKYVEAKLDIGRKVGSSKKRRRLIVANTDDKEAERFLSLDALEKLRFSLLNAEPYEVGADGVKLKFKGEAYESALPGIFNISNILGALTIADALGIPPDACRRALTKLSVVRGRMERVEARDPSIKTKQDFTVVVDYAHTADSMEKAYSVFDDRRIICVFGATGGGRDKWKRKEMGRVADKHCAEIILTDDDPYDEDSEEIARGIAEGISRQKPRIIIDRREAIKTAISEAKTDDVVMITGKGTDAYLMKKNGEKIPWDDAGIARAELEKVLRAR